MNRRADPQAFVSKVCEIVTEVFEEVGQEATEKLKESISTPYPPASSPGERPHLRTGELRDGAEYIVHSDGEQVEFQQGVNRPSTPRVAGYLEQGTPGGQMAPRPFVQPIKDEFATQFRDRSIERLRNEFQQKGTG